jgi:hypothetical protein
MKPDKKLIERFDDLVNEEDLSKLFSYSKRTLRQMRQTGKIKRWTKIEGTRRILYSKTEIAELLNLQMK